MSALAFLKEFDQLIKDSSEDGLYGKVEIDANLCIHSRVICAITELEAFEKLKLEKDEEIENLKKIAKEYMKKYDFLRFEIDDPIADKKARDIVAMLFWRMKRAQRNLKHCKIVGSLSNKVCKAKEQEASFAFTDSMRVLKS